MGLFEDIAAATGGKLKAARSHERPLLAPEKLRCGDPARVREVVWAIQNTAEHFPTRDDLVALVSAIRGALDDTELAREFAHVKAAEYFGPGGDTNSEAEVDSIFDSLNPPRLGFPHLLDAARRSATPEAYARLWFDDVTPELLATEAANQNGTAHSVFDETPEPSPAPRRRVELVGFRDLVGDNFLKLPSRPLVKGLLEVGTLSVVYGDSNVGKTAVVLDAALAIAAGTPWAGLKTTRGTVVYVAAEGGRGVVKRLEAWRRRYPKAEPAFMVVPMALDLYQKGADLDGLIAAMRAVSPEPVLLILDTLSRVMNGGDQDKTADMTSMVNNLGRLQEATGVHVMVIHHTGKDPTRGARGSNALRAAADTEILVGDGTIETTKQRDLDRGFRMGFRRDVVELGRDADGDPITSITVTLTAASEAVGEATAAEARVLDALRDMLSDGGLDGVRPEAIAARLAECGTPIAVEGVRSHLRNAERKALVVKPKRGLWALSRIAAREALIRPIDESEDEGDANGRTHASDLFE